MRILCPKFLSSSLFLRKVAHGCLWMLLLCAPLQGQNGTLQVEVNLCGANPNGSDVAVNTIDNSVWVIDGTSGKICVFSSSSNPPSLALANMIDHPVGAAVAPLFQPQCSGLAYSEDSNTFWILNSTSLELIEMSPAGAAIGSPVPFTITGSASGLAYDSQSGTLWTRDTVNLQAIEIDPSSGAILSTLAIPGADFRYGSGLSFRSSATGLKYLDFTYGDAFDAGVQEVRSLAIGTGELQCSGIHFDEPNFHSLLGICYNASQSSLMAVSSTSLVQINATQPAIYPPADLVCLADGEGAVNLDWRNCGPGGGGLYTLLRITRNGAIVDTLPGSATSWSDSTAPLDETHLYQVQGIVGNIIESASCTVTQGTGGLAHSVTFVGDRPRDLAYDEEMDDLYVTESFSGVIHVLGSDLLMKRSIDTGLLNLRGIGYNPILDVLLVSRAGSGLVTFIDPLTGSPLSSFPSNSSSISVISYDSASDDWLLLDTESSQVQIRRMEALEGAEGNPLGVIVPPSTSGLLLGGGLATFADGSLLSGVENLGAITSASQFTQFGFPLNFNLPLTALGNSPQLLDNAVTGFEIVGSTLVIAGQATNTLFQLLIVSDGPDFIRGDSDSSGTVNLADAIFTATWIYAGGTAPDCQDSCDANDDGQLDISDPIYTLLHLFTGTAAPPAPYPSSGPDPTFLDQIDC
ncbi:MAG: hypothetical protein OSB12_01530 [Planctomycetota bacterium]|nr:hypothetical protein [Planctomycetota bacterium]